jgi:CheY-like chemotaxis protein
MARILVADDEPGVRRLVRLTLELEGHMVTEAADGAGALAAAHAVPPDCVVLDVMMPGMDGLEVCRRLRANSQTATTPVVLLSAKAQEADVAAGLAAGADRYLTKPFEPLDLAVAVEDLIYGRSTDVPD